MTTETEVRASQLAVGDTYAEDGLDPATIAALDYHGDTVLITTTDGTETTLDADTVVALNPDTEESTMTEIAIGTTVIHTRHAGTFIYDGEHESGPNRTQVVGHLREAYMGIVCDPLDVAPVDVNVPEKSPRVIAEKVPSPRSYGPKLVWRATIDGEPLNDYADTRKSILAQALRTMAIRDFHNDHVMPSAQRVNAREGV